MNNHNILQCINLCKQYNTSNDTVLTILNNINLIVKMKETVSIVGSSGSGKSTLLHLLAGLDTEYKGDIIIDNKTINKLSDRQLCQLRNVQLGFIYQSHCLLAEFNALENVLMPLLIHGIKIDNTTNKSAIELLTKLGLSQRIKHYPAQLSGGEKQRVAIARALIHSPSIIFADEPTGNLDHQTAKEVFNLFLELQQQFNTAIIMVTHDINLAKQTNTMYQLSHQKLTILSN